MLEKIEQCFDALQSRDMKPTPHNVSIMDGVYSLLREVYGELKKKEEKTDGGPAADPDGRNTD